MAIMTLTRDGKKYGSLCHQGFPAVDNQVGDLAILENLQELASGDCFKL